MAFKLLTVLLVKLKRYFLLGKGIYIKEFLSGEDLCRLCFGWPTCERLVWILFQDFLILDYKFSAEVTPLKGFRADIFCGRDMTNNSTGKSQFHFYRKSSAISSFNFIWLKMKILGLGFDHKRDLALLRTQVLIVIHLMFTLSIKLSSDSRNQEPSACYWEKQAGCPVWHWWEEPGLFIGWSGRLRLDKVRCLNFGSANISISNYWTVVNNYYSSIQTTHFLGPLSHPTHPPKIEKILFFL